MHRPRSSGRHHFQLSVQDGSLGFWLSHFPLACLLTCSGATDPHPPRGWEGVSSPTGDVAAGEAGGSWDGASGHVCPWSLPVHAYGMGGPRALPSVNTLLPWVSCSLQRVVPELRGDGVAHGPPGRPEGPEPHPHAGAASPVHGRALQGVGPGHHPDGQPEEVSVPGRRAAGGASGRTGVRPPSSLPVPWTWLWTCRSLVCPWPSGPPRSCA